MPGHKHCSPLFSTKLNVATKHLNAALNEQKNRIINYMKATVSQMAQVRMVVYVRYHIAMLNLVKIGVEEVLHFVNHGKSMREGKCCRSVCLSGARDK